MQKRIWIGLVLLGVLVVIAIAAIGLFKPKLEDLWNATVSGMASL